MPNTNDYLQYRGKCKEMSEALIAADPTLTLVRGHYDCPIWGLQEHWWCVNIAGVIIDPTVKQFPSNGLGTYIPFSGKYDCEECKKKISEDDVIWAGSYPVCSGLCYGRLVGVDISNYTNL